MRSLRDFRIFMFGVLVAFCTLAVMYKPWRPLPAHRIGAVFVSCPAGYTSGLVPMKDNPANWLAFCLPPDQSPPQGNPL